MAWNDPPSFDYQQLSTSGRKFKHRYVLSDTKLGQSQINHYQQQQQQQMSASLSAGQLPQLQQFQVHGQQQQPYTSPNQFPTAAQTHQDQQQPVQNKTNFTASPMSNYVLGTTNNYANNNHDQLMFPAPPQPTAPQPFYQQPQ